MITCVGDNTTETPPTTVDTGTGIMAGEDCAVFGGGADRGLHSTAADVNVGATVSLAI